MDREHSGRRRRHCATQEGDSQQAGRSARRVQHALGDADVYRREANARSCLAVRSALSVGACATRSCRRERGKRYHQMPTACDQSRRLPGHAHGHASLAAAKYLPRRSVRLVATRRRAATDCGDLAILLTRRKRNRRAGPLRPAFFASQRRALATCFGWMSYRMSVRRPTGKILRSVYADCFHGETSATIVYARNHRRLLMSIPFKTVLAVAGVVVATQAAAQVTSYEREDFRGRAFTADRRIGNLDRMGFDDKASSAVVESGRWQVCEDPGFRGRCAI